MKHKHSSVSYLNILGERLIIAVLFLFAVVNNTWAIDYELMLTLNLASPAASKEGSSTAITTDDGIKTYLQSAIDSKGSQIKSGKKESGDIYNGKGSGGTGIPQKCLKIGKASGGGKFSFTIADSYDDISKVEITGYGWKTTTEVKINSSTGQKPTKASEEVTFIYELATATKTITVEVSTSAFCATEIKLYKTASTGSKKTVLFYDQDCPAGCSYSASPGTKGSQTISGTKYTTYSDITVGESATITATAGTGYSFDGWKDDSNNYIVVDEDGTEITPTSSNATTFTFKMPDKDVYIWSCNFSSTATPYNITYKVPSCVTSPMDNSTNSTTTFASSATPAISGYTFEGWTTKSDYVSSNTAPSPLYTGGSATSAVATVYAVYSQTTGDATKTTFNVVKTTKSSVTAMDIAAGWYVFTSGQSGSQYAPNSVYATKKDGSEVNKITSTDVTGSTTKSTMTTSNANAIWKVESAGDHYYTIKNYSNSKYLAFNSVSNEIVLLDAGTTDGAKWQFIDLGNGNDTWRLKNKLQLDSKDVYLKHDAKNSYGNVWYCNNGAPGTDHTIYLYNVTVEPGSSTKTYTFDPQCPVTKYTVTYVANSGTTTCTSGSYTEGSTVYVCATEPTRSGYKFTGWKSNETTPQTYNAGDSFTMPAKNITLTAQWEEVTYIYFAECSSSCEDKYCINSYDAGGNGMKCFTDQGSNIWTITNYAVPATGQDDRNLDLWVGYNGAWATHSENWHFRWIPFKNLSCDTYKLGVAAGAIGTLTIKSNSTNKNYELTFDPNGYGFVYGTGSGTWTSLPFTRIGETNVWKTDVVSVSDVISHSYYVGLAKSGGGYVYSDNYDYNDANEHIKGISNTTTISGMGVISNATTNTFRATNLSSSDSSLKGYFRIWTDNCNKNFYCHFVPVYTVTYKSYDGSTTLYTEEVAAGSSFTVRAAETGAAGWAESASQSSASANYAVSATKTPTANVTLYVAMTAYTVTYSIPTNGGTAKRDGSTVTSDVVLSGNMVTLPTVEGSTLTCAKFVGWYAGDYDNATKPSILAAGSSYTPEDDVTLKALYAIVGDNYELVTKVSDLVIGSQVVIAAATLNTYSVAAGAYNSNGYFAPTAISVTDNILTFDDDAGVTEFELADALNSKYAFKTGNNYLVSADKSLKTSSTLADGCKYSITIDNTTSAATISATVSSTSYLLSYNYNNGTNSRFSSYKQSQTCLVKIFQRSISSYTTAPACVSHTVTLAVSGHASGSAKIGSVATAATTSTSQSQDVSASGSVKIKDIAAVAGYTATVSITSGTATLTDNGDGTYTVSSPTSDVTVTVTYTKKTSYDITFNVGTAGTGTYTKLTAYNGQTVTIPATYIPTSSCGTFVGWSPGTKATSGDKPSTIIAAGSNYTHSTDAAIVMYAVYSFTGGCTPEFAAGKSGEYLVYAENSSGTKYYVTKKTSTPSSGESTSFYMNEATSSYYNPATLTVSYNKNTSKYCILYGDLYLGLNSSANLEFNSAAFEWTLNSNTCGYYFTGTSSGGTSKILGATNSGGDPSRFNAYSSSSTPDDCSQTGYSITSFALHFEVAGGVSYYTDYSCSSTTVDVTFDWSGTMNWSDNASWNSAAKYKGLARCTEIDIFPEAEYTGWTFLGWSTTEYNATYSANLDDENNGYTADPGSTSLYSNSGNSLTLGTASVTLYPVFTKYADNADFDIDNGGDYYMYYYRDDAFFKDSYYSKDSHLTRMYATAYPSSGGEMDETSSCASAQLFNFTKRSDGYWNIRLKNTDGSYPTNSYITNPSGNDFAKAVAVEPTYGWDILAGTGGSYVIRYVGNSSNWTGGSIGSGTLQTYNNIKAFHSGTTMSFKCYNQDSEGSSTYKAVYLGTCEERIFSSSPIQTYKVTFEWTQGELSCSYSSCNKVATVPTTIGMLTLPDLIHLDCGTFIGWTPTQPDVNNDGITSWSSAPTFDAPATNKSITENITLYAVYQYKDNYYHTYLCGIITLTDPDNTNPALLLTSAAGQRVRSARCLNISGSDLPANTAVTFSILDAGTPLTRQNAVFSFGQKDGTPIMTDGDGNIADGTEVWVFYKPLATDTRDNKMQDDQLDIIASEGQLVASVGTGDAKVTASLTDGTEIRGRHLAQKFVIAVKVGNVWLALPADIATGVHEGVPIKVDDMTNPTKAIVTMNTTGYELRELKDTRFKYNGSAVNIFSLVSSKGLRASGAKNSNSDSKNIATRATTTVDGVDSLYYEWQLNTTDLVTYNFINCRKADNSGTAYSNNQLFYSQTAAKWGLYANATSNNNVSEIRLLPIEAELTELGAEVMEWGTNQLALRIPDITNVSGNQLNITFGDKTKANVTLTNLNDGTGTSDLYKADGLIVDSKTLADYSCQLLIIENTAGTYGSMMRLPIMTNTSTTTEDIRTSVGSDVCPTCDLVILRGGLLTSNDARASVKTTFFNIYVYPGGKLKIDNASLGMNSHLYLRGGWSFLGGDFAMPQAYINQSKFTNSNNAIYDYYIDNKKFYWLSLPYEVKIADVSDEVGYKNFSSWLAYYDGAARATGSRTTGWKDYDGTNFTYFGEVASAADVKLVPGIGYNIAAKPRKKLNGDAVAARYRPYAIVRFPLSNKTFNGNGEENRDTPTVNVTAHGYDAYQAGTQTANNVGWNLVGNPFLAAYGGAVEGTANITVGKLVENDVIPWDGTYVWKDESVKYITLPNLTRDEYSQVKVSEANVPAFTSFFVQTKTSGTLSFSASNRKAVPAALRAPQQANREVSVDITLSQGDNSDMTGLVISNDYTIDYEIGDDLEKLSGATQMVVYTVTNGYRLAFNALNETVAAQPIPVGFSVNSDGVYSISLRENNDLRHVESIILIDYEEGGIEIDLLAADYTFYAKAERNNESRFAIYVRLKQDGNIGTAIDATASGGLRDVSVYAAEGGVVLHGVPASSRVWVYDMTGKLLLETTHSDASTRMTMNLPAGVYNIRLQNNADAKTIRTIVQ